VYAIRQGLVQPGALRECQDPLSER
jgi:hypothetical protein